MTEFITKEQAEKIAESLLERLPYQDDYFVATPDTLRESINLAFEQRLEVVGTAYECGNMHNGKSIKITWKQFPKDGTPLYALKGDSK
jgi:hypothetical protein